MSSGPRRQLTGDMNRFRGELTEKDRELLKIRRDSDTKACELAKMEKMLQETKGLLDKKSESSSAESKTDDMGLYRLLAVRLSVLSELAAFVPLH